MRIVLSILLVVFLILTSTTIAREALHWHDRPLRGWECPSCGTRNASDPQAAFAATCRRCDLGHDWRRVLTNPEENDDQFVASLGDRLKSKH